MQIIVPVSFPGASGLKQTQYDAKSGSTNRMIIRSLAAFTIVTLALVAPLAAQTPVATAPRVFLINPQAYVRAKQDSSPPFLAKVKSEAAKAMKTPLLSVTMKPQTPPSGDKHDYLSMAIYWWPDPKNPTGPYISRDG